MAQNVTQPFFVKNNYLTFAPEISCPKLLASSVVSKKLPKVNNCLIGKNSANLVTLNPTNQAVRMETSHRCPKHK
jgi:hypothetical protein